MTEAASVLPRLTTRQVVWLVALVAFATYLPTVLDGYVFDDVLLVQDNPYAHELGYLGRCFTTDLFDTPARPNREAWTLFYRPFVCASYVLNWKAGFGTAFGFHLVNVLMHAAACALAAPIAIRWTGSRLAGLLAALLFALHPSRSENVTWISGRTDVLMAVAFFGAHELALQASRKIRATGLWVGALASYLVALLSKEYAVLWPVWLAVEAAIAHERGREESRKKLLGAGAAALVIALGYVAIRGVTLPINPPQLADMQLPPLARVTYVLLSIGYYAERIVFPWPHTFHFRPIAFIDGEPSLSVPSIVAGGVVAALFAVWIARAWKRDRVLAYILVAGVIITLPVVNVVYTGFRDVTQDRFLYLPLLVLGIAALRQLREPLERWATASRIAPLLVFSTAFLCAALNWIRALDFASDEALWRHELEVNPDDPHALAALAEYVSAEGDVEGAIALLDRSRSPAASRFRLLANPTNAYVVRLEYQGPRLADGYASALSALLAHIVDLARGAPLHPGRAGDMELRAPVEQEAFRNFVANAASHLASAGALVASRIGRDDLVRLLVASIDEKAPIDVAARYNLALALGRGGDYSGARRQLAVGRSVGLTAEMTKAFDGLGATLESIKEQRLRAAGLPEPLRSLTRGRAFLELGAYLRAARALREAYQVAPDDAAVKMAYFDALVNARLEADARVIAEKTFGPELAKEKLDEAEHHLSPRTAHAVPPPPTERWWVRPVGVRED